MSTIDLEPGLGYADYLEFPDDGLRHELVGGIHVVSPAPWTRHQVVATAIISELFARIDRAGAGHVLAAPTDVFLSDEDIVQPDAVVVLHGSAAKLVARGIVGPPDLVIEVLSRSTRRVDVGPKRERYAAGGVGEYWIVDPDRLRLWQLVRRAGDGAGDGFAEPVEHRERVTFTALGMTLDLGPIWARVEEVPPK